MMPPAFWIGVAASNHVELAVKGGFAQLGHGKHLAVKNLRKGDWIAYYSPRSELGSGGQKVHAFTAIGKITSDEPYQVTQNEQFMPWRLDVEYVPTAIRAPIHPLLERLELTKGRGSKWGLAVRKSKVRVSQCDFQTICCAMGVRQDVVDVGK